MAVHLPPDELTPESIKRVASEHFGRLVALTAENVQRQKLGSVKEFFPAARRMIG